MGRTIITEGDIGSSRSEDDRKMLDEADSIMDRARAALARLAASKEARLIIQEIDDWRLRR
jgi:hypothetical protein